MHGLALPWLHGHESAAAESSQPKGRPWLARGVHAHAWCGMSHCHAAWLMPGCVCLASVAYFQCISGFVIVSSTLAGCHT